jgi:hypothetical protein
MLQQAARGPNWLHVGVFLGLTFGLTWLLDLAMRLRGGLDTPGVVTALQLQMLLPASSAILLGWRWFPESPLYHRRQAGRPRWFYSYFLFLTVVYGVGALGVWRASCSWTRSGAAPGAAWWSPSPFQATMQARRWRSGARERRQA